MKIFPYALLRIASISSDDWKVSIYKHFDNYINRWVSQLTSFNNVEKLFLEDVKYDSTIDYFTKIKIKNTIESRNYVKAEKLINKLLDNLVLLNKFSKLKEQWLHLNTLENEILSVYESTLFREKQLQSEISQQHNFRNGFLYATGKEVRELKTESDTLLKYITRNLFKTSPFSSFTFLNFCSLEEISTTVNYSNPESVVYLNNYLLSMINLSMEYLELKENVLNLKIARSNSVVNSINSDLLYVYNCNHFNNETITKAFTNKAIKEILETNIIQEVITIKELKLYFLKNNQEVPENLITVFITNLFNVGLLKFEMILIENPEKWIDKVKAVFLESTLNSEIKSLLINLLQSISSLLQELHYFSAPIQQKKTILDSLYNEFILVENALNELSKSQFIKINKERMVYEDCYLQNNSTIDKSEITSFINQLDALMDIISTPKTQDHSILTLFNLKFSSLEDIPLLLFFEEYSKNVMHFGKSIADINEAKHYKNVLAGHTYEKDDKIENNITDFKFEANENQIVLNVNLEKKSNKTKRYRSGMFQFVFENNKISKLVVSTLGSGYSKMFSRFLNSPKSVDILKKIQEWNNNSNDTDEIWVDLADFSTFNANIHPQLMPYSISYFGETDQSKKICLKDLFIKWEQNQLIVFHKPSNKRVLFFDFGFQTLNGRSNLYQFLSQFQRLENYGINKLFTYLEDKLKQELKLMNTKEFTFIPRIVLNEIIILRRACWLINREKFVSLLEGGSSIKNFLKLNHWYRNAGIPKDVFVKIIPNNSNKSTTRNSDNYKPQYIDFGSPELVNYFIKIVTKSTNCSIILEEMFPLRDQQMIINNKSYVTEHYLQWNNN